MFDLLCSQYLRWIQSIDKSAKEFDGGEHDDEPMQVPLSENFAQCSIHVQLQWILILWRDVDVRETFVESLPMAGVVDMEDHIADVIEEFQWYHRPP